MNADQLSLADVLSEYVERSGYSSGQLSRLTDVPKPTLVNWLSGRVQKPRRLNDLLKVAASLHLDMGEASRLLAVCGYPPIARLMNSRNGNDYAHLLTPWATSFSHSGIDAPFQAIRDLPYFVGRESELQTIEDVLVGGQDGAICIIQGMAGVGKTTLAAHAAYRLRVYFHEGVLWADLKTSDTMSVLSTFARAYGYDVSEYRDIGSRSRMVRDILAKKRVLIVLDNARNSQDVEPLLPPSGPCAVIITTRRQDLTVSWGLCRVSLEPFDKHKREALSLFAKLLTEDYVRKEEACFAKLADLLGHLPLAIAIAASRLAYETNWSPEDFVRRIETSPILDELVAEQNSVRLTFTLSYEMLTPEKQQYFAALSTFGGRDFGIEAAARVLQISPDEAIDNLREFFNLSLVQTCGTNRYRLHPMLHTYASEHLGDDNTIERMVDYYVHLAEDNSHNYSLLEVEMSNILAALEIAYQQNMTNTFLGGLKHFRRFLRNRGFYDRTDALSALAETIARDLEDSPRLVVALFDRGQIARVRGEYDRANHYLLESLALVVNNNYQEDIGVILVELGIVAEMQADYDQAEIYFREGLTLFYRDADRRGITWVLLVFGVLEMSRLNLEQAEAYLQEGLKLTRTIDHPERCADLLMTLGMLTSKQGDQVQAELLLSEALTIAETVGNQSLIATARMGLGIVYGRHGDVRQAKLFIRDGLSLARKRGQSWTISRLLNEWGNIAFGLQDLTAACEAFQESLTIAQSTKARGQIGEAMYGLARLCAFNRDFTAADRYGQECLAIFRAIKHPQTAEVECWYANQRL